VCTSHLLGAIGRHGRERERQKRVVGFFFLFFFCVEAFDLLCVVEIFDEW
jgi:hypothetical protein